MLRPTKNTDPARSLLVVSASLLKRLRRKRVEGFVELRQFLRDAHSGADKHFLPALNLLYALGLVEYRVKTDAFEYVGPS